MQNIDKIQCDYKNIIKSLDLEQRCLVWCDLNCWKWNSLLGEKPDNWDSTPIHVKVGNMPLKQELILPIMRCIEVITKRKDIDKYWNCSYGDTHIRMSLEDFNKKFNGLYYFKKKILSILNKGGIYTLKQKEWLTLLNEIAEKDKKEEMREMYGG